ncbi:MAG: biopolymer transporter ExbD [Muribaculaceae bacterium]|nr:biopolymer transporter ExbD [Muribaculaceae bacterium]
MGKVKIKKKETRIDMTAMSDVTVLLLTFFMLTSTFLQKEPVQVITPPSVSEDKVPDQKLLTILVTTQKNAQGEAEPKVYMELVGTADSSIISSEALREETLKEFCSKRNINNLTAEDIQVFKKQNAFGMPAAKLKQWLSLKDEDERSKMLESEGGIPIKWTTDEAVQAKKLTEFQEWVQAAYAIYYNKSLELDDKTVVEDMKNGKGIAVKADQGTPYSIVEVIMNNLQTIHRNKFTLMTALKTDSN